LSTPRPSIPVVTAAERCLGSIDGHEPGPTLLAIGALHGNEPAGVAALQRIVEDLSTNG